MNLVNLFVKKEIERRKSRVNLKVDFEDYQIVRQLGAFWDEERNRWYINCDNEIEYFMKWTH
jgi:hypothetical protein